MATTIQAFRQGCWPQLVGPVQNRSLYANYCIGLGGPQLLPQEHFVGASPEAEARVLGCRKAQFKNMVR